MEIIVKREQNDDGTITETVTFTQIRAGAASGIGRTTTKPKRPKKSHFQVLLHALCSQLPDRVNDKDSADTVHLPAMLETTRNNFTVKELSADMGYISEKNLQTVVDAGSAPLIPPVKTKQQNIDICIVFE